MAKKTSKRRSKRQGSGTSTHPPDPCTYSFIHHLGSMIEYLDNSCTSVVEGIRFPSDSTTVLGDMDTVDLEQMEMDTVGDTTVDYSEVKPVYSYTTGDGTYDDSTALSASSRTSYSTPSKNPSRSPKKKVQKGPVANFNIVGRLHAKVPETNTSSIKKKGTFDDNSIVTAPTDSFTSSKGSDTNLEAAALAQNLQNTVIVEEEQEEKEDEVAPVSQERTPSNASSFHSKNNAPPPSPALPRRPLTQAEQKDAAIAQGLDLCRRIRQSYQHPKASPIQQQGSFRKSSSSIGNPSESPGYRQSSSDNNDGLEDAASVPRTKMYGEKAASSAQPQPVENNNNNNHSDEKFHLPLPPVPKRKSTGMSKIKEMVPFGRKASF